MAVQRYSILMLDVGPLHFESFTVGSVTRVLMVQIQRFLISESLEGARPDGMQI